MKQSKIVWLIVAGALVLLGAALFVAAMAANHWDFSKLNSTKYESRTVEIREEFQNISIRTETEDISFVLSDDGSCRVVFYETEQEAHTATVSDGTLSIELVEHKKWYDSFTFFSVESPKITVYLPQSKYRTLSIEGSTGDVSIPKEFHFAQLSASVSTGDVSCAASVSEALRVKTETGRIYLEKLSAGELELSSSTGRVELRSVECAGALRVEVSTGRVELAELSCRSLHSVGSTGDIRLDRVKAAEKMEITRSTGDVRLENSDAGELTIETDTGSVSGTLSSPKIFFTRSDTGSIHVPETTTGGTCRITTDTGDIQISVAG